MSGDQPREEKMANKLWDDVRKSLQDLGNIASEKGRQFSKVAAEKAEELTAVGKIRLELLQVNRDIERQFTELGGKVYDLKTEGALETINDVTEIHAIFDKIAVLEEKKKALEEKLHEQKKAAKPAEEAESPEGEEPEGPIDSDAEEKTP